MKRLALSLIVLFLFITNAFATDKYWVGGGATTNWNATGNTNWALTSGGANNAAVPVAGDNVIFDGNSGTGASVWNTAISLVGLNCTGSKNLVTHNAVTITLSAGNLVLPTGVGGTYTALGTTSLFTFTATSGTQQITTNGFLPGGLTLNGAGGTFQLQDNLALFVNAASTLTLTAGTFAAQAFTVTIGRFSGANANTKALTGSGLWTLSGTGAVWALTNTGTTITSFTSNVTASANSATTRTFTAASGMILQGTLTVAANPSGGMFEILSTMTLGNLAVSGPNALRMPTGGSVVTLTNAPTIAGTSGNEILFITDNSGVLSTISVASGNPTFAWTSFRDMTFLGGATFAATNSLNLGGNTGITITAPGAGGGGCIIGGWLLWRDLPAHINDNFPAWIEKAA